MIVSSLPVKRGLGSSTALVVALYTFLEAITNLYTGNILEKTLACHLAKKLAAGNPVVRLVDIVASVIGRKDTITAFNARSLRIDRLDWNSVNVEMLLIAFANTKMQKPTESSRDKTRNKEVMTVLNTMSRWRTNPLGTSIMKLLFPEETIKITEHTAKEDERISKMTNMIKEEQWNELGRI